MGGVDVDVGDVDVDVGDVDVGRIGGCCQGSPGLGLRLLVGVKCGGDRGRTTSLFYNLCFASREPGYSLLNILIRILCEV